VADRQRVLIVDDTPENIQILMEALKADYRITAATNGPKALELAAKEPHPDIVLLDVMMPEMDGYEVCERLKADAATRDIPVIFVTAMTQAGDEARGLELGAVDYITKPINPGLVRARVHNQVELKLHRDRLEELVEERTRELLAATAEKQKFQTQLELARDLQQAMLPARRHAGPGFEIAAMVEAATMVGGDLFDYFPVGTSRLVFLVGDVSGKGVPAALFMVRALTVIRTVAAPEVAPAEILAVANRELCRENDSFMFVTACCGILDLQTGEISLASAGHELPLRLSPGGSAELIEVPGGPALGIDEESEYPETKIRLGEEEVLLLYTDGITDAENPEREFFSEERLLEVAPRLGGRDAGAVADGLIDEIREFVRGAPQSDDITVLALGRRAGDTSEASA
jgi:sigma-B regulation protein RsbU (phosphoserine phosphatase)